MITLTLFESTCVCTRTRAQLEENEFHILAVTMHNQGY